MEKTTERDTLITKKTASQAELAIKSLRVGEIIEGKIIGKDRSAVYLDLGPQGTGIIYGREFYIAKGQLKDLNIDDNVFTKIMDLENEAGYIELSLSGASKEITWDQLKQMKEKGEEISVKILGANKGGLLAEIAGIRGFLPISQLSPEHYPKVEGGDSAKILKELQKFISKELSVRIFDLDEREEKLILSERAKETERIKEVLKNYKVGDIVEGEISGVTDFGAFIKFLPPASEVKEGASEPLEGLIHISELDWKIIEDPAAIVKVGEKVKVKIIDINNDKISLSLKALKKDPWMEVESKYKKGDKVLGKVTKFNPFGAFIQITPEIQGLCHISEFGTKIKMEETVKIGESHNFQILEIRPEEHRMSLRLAEKE